MNIEPINNIYTRILLFSNCHFVSPCNNRTVGTMASVRKRVTTANTKRARRETLFSDATMITNGRYL